ncbi:restriction endonuclease subunit S [Streptomyces microflavus]|uniref:restriction endonuclease subunit S n=1 Tax=Streptomyces microflavus TaxID=1919 RepID=UPI0036751281
MSAEPDEIRWVPVGEAGEVRMGKQLSPASRDAPGQMPYLRVANVFEGHIDYRDVNSMGFTDAEKSVYSLRSGDILLNEGQESLANVGRSAIFSGTPNSVCFQNTLIRFRASEGVLPEYAQAIFVNWRRLGKFARVAEKTSISHLGGSRFARMMFPLVSLLGQRRIVEVLDAVQESERAAQAAIDKLRVLRLDAVSSELSSLVESGNSGKVRWIPVREAGAVRMGKQLSPEGRRSPSQHPYLRVANVLDGRIDFSDVKSMGFTHSERQVYGLQPGDILLNEGQSLELVGRSAIYAGEAGDFCFQNTLVRFRPCEGLLSQYAQAVFGDWLRAGKFAQIAKQTTSIAHLGGERFGSLEFPLIPVGEQRRIVNLLKLWDARISSEEIALDKLRDLRRGLMGDLLSGMSSIDGRRRGSVASCEKREARTWPG